MDCLKDDNMSIERDILQWLTALCHRGPSVETTVQLQQIFNVMFQLARAHEMLLWCGFDDGGNNDDLGNNTAEMTMLWKEHDDSGCHAILFVLLLLM